MLNKGYIGENEVIEIENALDEYYKEKEVEESAEIENEISAVESEVNE